MKQLFEFVITSDMETPFFNSMITHPLCLAEKEEKWAWWSVTQGFSEAVACFGNDCEVGCEIEKVLENVLGFVWKVISIVNAIGVG